MKNVMPQMFTDLRRKITAVKFKPMNMPFPNMPSKKLVCHETDKMNEARKKTTAEEQPNKVRNTYFSCIKRMSAHG